jgi:ATP-dependent helicase HrpA
MQLEETSIRRANIGQLLAQALSGDYQKLWRQWQQVDRRQAQGKPVDKALARLARDIGASQARVEARRAALPTVTFPENLPISEKRQALAELIEKHQVVIIAGETGSGKTTQIPKICLEIGRGVRGVIGHTQPRRIAARTVANRIAEELQVPLGASVGYQVRFTDQTDPNTHVKLMTDGILLAEIQNDPLLRQYDTLIIDEAHERSLNIDFLLGYLKQLLPKRPDLKIIITSATINLERFSEHFDNAPYMEVSGRTYPVEVLYRPWQGELEDQTQGILEAIEELMQLSKGLGGDILVFMSGEREIRETSHAIRKAGFQGLEVLPLYARLNLAEQNRIFQNHKGRRVVLATNVAETSITVPGIRYVIDPGYARISRYSVRTKVQRLPIEPISQASANQRKGRCGRLSEGICIRLYEREDFELRPAFTDPEILRTNLAAVVLQMLALRIGDVRRFPFVDKPDNRQITDGFKLLEELHAVDAKGELTAIGRQLNALPLDPRLGRMVIEAQKLGCLQEVLVIVAALTIQDPRERPVEKQQAADEKHRRFRHEDSDFLAFVNLWNYVEEQRQELSQNQWRKQCGKEFLNFMRLREWRELHHQLRVTVKQLGFKQNQEPASYEQVHRALVTGLLGNIGLKNEEKDARDYFGARNRRFMIFPGSSLFKKRPKWLMAGELLETSKLYAHHVARTEPQWVLDAAEHLVKHHYYEPYYNPKSGQVMGYDRITLYGLVLAEKQRVHFSHVEPKVAREVFIRSALVEGSYAKSYGPRSRRSAGKFFEHNQAVIDEINNLEAKARRRDIMVDDEELYAFYDERIPADVVNLAGFEHWRKQAERDTPRILHVTRERLMLHAATDVTVAQFPDHLNLDGMDLPLTYHFEPGHADDGVSIGVPAGILHSVPEHRLDWLVPGLLREKCIALLKGLPKQWRKQFVPVPHYVDQILARVAPQNRALTEVISEQLQRLTGVELPADVWNDVSLDDYYRMNIHVLDEEGRVIERGRDLTRLREKYRDQIQAGLQEAGSDIEREDLTRWDFGELPETCSFQRGAVTMRGYPALVDEQGKVALRVLDNPLEARYQSRRGVARLIALMESQTTKYLQKNLLKNKDIGLTVVDLGRREAVVDDAVMAAIGKACLEGKPLPRTAEDFQRCRQGGAGEIVGYANQYEALLLEILTGVIAIKKQMKQSKNSLALTFTFADIKDQLDRLLYRGFLWDTPLDWLQQYPRYLKAIQIRLDKAAADPQKDKLAIASLQDHWQRHDQRMVKLGAASYAEDEQWQLYRWMLEELRVSLFAQSLKTRMPVSDKRLVKQWAVVVEQ